MEPITLGAAENKVWTEVAGLFRDDMDDETTQPPPCYNVAGMFRAYYLASGESSPLYGFTNPANSEAERRSDRISIWGAEADIKAAGRKINGVRVDALVQLLHSRGRLTESCLLKSNRFLHSGCWLAGPGGFLAGSTNLNPAEYKMALRLRLLRSPTSATRRVVSCAGAIGGFVSQQIPCISFIARAVKANIFAGTTISGTLSSTRSVMPFDLKIPMILE
jgi:hypothetical protein